MGSERDYLVLDFKGTDKFTCLAIKSSSFALISVVRHLRSVEWEALNLQSKKARPEVRLRNSTRASSLYQSRLQTAGHSFADTQWMKELSESLY